MIEDAELLRRYCNERSEAAFTELVQRHVNLVYYAALRRVGGDAHLADDVTQSVFTALARKASSLTDRPVLAGWLYTSTRFAAAQAVRSEKRRRNHEQESSLMHELHSTPNCHWEQLRPIIDDAMDELNEREREAVLLRFFENRSLAEVGAKFSLSPDAARMRVDRALDKLRGLLAKRGIASTSAALATLFITQSGLAAPTGLVAKIVSGVVSQAGAATAATIALWKMVTGVALAGLGAGFVVYHVNQHHRLSAAPAASVANSGVTLSSAPALAPAAPLAGLRDHGASLVEGAGVGRSPVKIHRTTDDFGWPRVGLFSGDAVEKPRHTVAEFRAKMREDDAFRAVVAEQANDRLELFYGYLFKSLNLPEPQWDQFKSLLVEKEKLKIDTLEAQNAVGFQVRENRGLFREGVDQGQQAVDAEIKMLLGDSAYIKYLQYREDLVPWAAANGVAEKLQATSTPLTDEQAAKLVVLLRESLLRIRPPFTFDIGIAAGVFSGHIGSSLTEHVFRQAGEFLSEPQVEALRQLRKQRLVNSR
jgi:RNA polymerase sigma factor (sigma-70 family)